MFAVFGVTQKVLIRLADKKVSASITDPEKRKSAFEKALVRLTEKKKPVMLTPEFSAPEMADKALQLLAKEPGADSLKVFIRAAELSKTKKGKSRISRKWVEYVPGKQYKTADQLLGVVSNETI